MPLFSRIVIVGTGLMGGSVGLAVKKQGVAGRVVGIDHSVQHLETALARGAIDLATTDFEDGVCRLGVTERPRFGAPSPELIVVATPVGIVVDHVRRAVEVFRKSDGVRNVLITDVGSTKEEICSQLNGPLADSTGTGCRFIGSHPIAGAEKSGPDASTESLFENKMAIVSPGEAIRDVDTGLLVRFWKSLGSTVLCIAPGEHDRILARTSHLPHLLSAVLADGLQMQHVPYTGSGFRSTTRLASGGPAMWRDIVSTNSAAILEAIRDYENDLRNLREKIEMKDWDGVAALLESAKRSRDSLEPGTKN